MVVSFYLFLWPFIVWLLLSSRISYILDSILSLLFRPSSHGSLGTWLVEGRAAWQAFSSTICTVLQSLAYQQSNCKANTKWYHTYLILLNFLGFPRLFETLIAKAQGSSFAVSLKTPHRLPARHAKFYIFVHHSYCTNTLLCSVLILHVCPLLSFLEALIIFKYLLCPIKGLASSCQHTFFNMSLSQ